MTRYIIQAGGVGYRWHDHLGVRKHKIVLDGEPVIDRTVRQLRGLGCDDIVIIAQDDDAYRLPGARWHLPDGYNDADNQVAALMLTRSQWADDKPTVLLYGDTWWSDAAIADVVAYDGPDRWHVWYRPGGSDITGREHGEVYAHWWRDSGQEHAACRRVIDLHESGLLPWRNVSGWAIYRAMLGLPDGEIDGYSTPGNRHATIVDDWTEDFDQPLDYVAWYGRRAAGRYAARIVFDESVPDTTRRLYPAQALHHELSVTDATVHVRANLAIGHDQFWCGVAHAVEHRVPVVPYSHTSGTPKELWEAEPMWTADDTDRRIVIVPAGCRGVEPVRLYGHCWKEPNV